MKNRDILAELLVELAESITYILTSEVGIPKEEAEAVAQKVAIHIADNWGGQPVYIPKDVAAKIASRNSQIYDQFTGDNQFELAREYGISSQHIYRIIKKEREKRMVKQGSLPMD